MRPTLLRVNNNRSVGVIFSPIILMVLLIILSVTFLPEILETGVSQWVADFQDSESPVLRLLLVIVLETYISLCIVRQVADYFKFSLGSQDIREIWYDQVNQNIPLQFVIILLGRRGYSTSELFIYAHNLVFYLIVRASSCYLLRKTRRQASENLRHAYVLLILSIVLHMLFMHNVFAHLGVLILLILHYEGFYILKDAAFSLCLMYFNKELPVELELRTGILENLVKLVQWSHIALIFSDIIPTNPANIFLFLKVQQYFLAFSEAVKKYRQFSVTLEKFLKEYPVNDSQISESQDKYCCICMEFIYSDGCQLACRHDFHLVCICKWIVTTKEKRCPLCSTVYLDNKTDKDMSSLLSLVTSSSDQDVARIQGVLPYVPEEDIRRELQETGNIDLAIENLLVN